MFIHSRREGAWRDDSLVDEQRTPETKQGMGELWESMTGISYEADHLR